MQYKASVVSKPHQPPPTPLEQITRIAYLVADDHQQDVFVVEKPPPQQEYRPHLPYCVLEEEASKWEKENGIRIFWRQTL